ncbi:hypothetical protein [Streptomyces sp. NPDC058240]|uniref:hypothetical protein n=1 Tax=Streptomyces sp. NPDC058240 TaxID=3346396 RepID=UPI0036E690E5
MQGGPEQRGQLLAVTAERGDVLGSERDQEVLLLAARQPSGPASTSITAATGSPLLPTPANWPRSMTF